MRFHLKAAAITAAAFALPLIASVVRAVPSSPQKGNPDMPMLNWAGKSKVVNHHNDVPFRVLERKWGFEDGALTQSRRAAECAENMVIHGDNLAALKALLPQYEGKVKCIYIDPPYNTGNEGWVYNDNVNDPQIKKWLGEVVGKEGEDFSRHDKWLCMMYPRLRLLQKLLAEDGAIFISIDDNEFANLRLICDEIFGLHNFVATFTWKSRAKPSNTGKAKYKPQNDSEFVLCYKGMGEADFLCVTSGKPRSYPHEDKDGRYRLQTILKSNRGENKRETMTFSLAGYTPPPTKRWQAGEERIKELYANNRITFETGEPMLKYYEHEEKEEVAPFWCHITKEISGTAESGKMALNQLLGNMHGFDTVKPVELIEYLLKHTLPKDSIVLDSFAGSGTTAHAVLKMNKEDGGDRKFILIEMMDYADKVTAERVKRVISGYGKGDKAVEGTGGGFGYYELGEPLMIGENLNENLPIEKIREYVWYMETRGAGNVASLNSNGANRADPYLLGVSDGAAYYFCYERGAAVKLNRALLRKLKTKAERYVVYADICLLDDSELEKYNITFKKIPRDIAQL
jgi:adenine-specific DNA-methyltransferase